MQLITLLTAIAGVFAAPSFVGDVSRAVGPTLMSAIKATVNETIVFTNLAIEKDVIDLVDNHIPSWVPAPLRNKFEDFLRKTVVDRISNVVIKTLTETSGARLVQLADFTAVKVMEVDAEVDRAIADIHNAIRQKIGIH